MLAALALPCAAAAPTVEPQHSAVEPQNGAVELWYVSTRSLNERDLNAPTLAVFRWDGQGQWLASTAAAVIDSADGTPMVLLVHGNRADADDSVRFAWPLYQQLHERRGRCRLIVWSWPADGIRGGPRRDVAVKVARTELESCFLARFVRGIPPATRVGMIGYSLGARTIGGALRLLHGESYAGRSLAGAATPRAPMRIVLVAGAMDQDALCAGDGGAAKWSDVQRIFVTKNHADRVLRWYPRMTHGWRGPAALGFAGPGCCEVPPGQLESVDLTCEIGRRHAWQYYVAAPGLRERLPWYAFVE